MKCGGRCKCGAICTLEVGHAEYGFEIDGPVRWHECVVRPKPKRKR